MRFIEEQLIRLDQEIQRRLQPYQQEYALLQTIPGIKETGAARVLSEIGPDMSPFPDGDHLSSWGGACPGNNESAGKKFQSKIRKGNRHLLAALTDQEKGLPFPKQILTAEVPTRLSTSDCSDRSCEVEMYLRRH